MIYFLPKFDDNLNKIYNYISLDSPSRADKFCTELFDKIAKIEYMPLSFRKNLQINRDDIRDLIFKGYVMPFLIKDGDYYVLDIYKNNEWSGI
ncbi:type II toxin-antitoxin system RelE/ParE family toxin [Campylobacter suis]|uniref:Plasmid stabilization protein n=1 Tax=Campylobacter suis TaxID=2790657 RepID=A0ABM8Q898_9BACT|nr:type II toxin-antitoxin system RelE/ParE family toxin [Campylobacter suis]CAD7289044.1 hypothetical protein LMG8286_01629 [Campylobacter suis]